MIKNILVHLDASPRAAVRLALAQQLARRHEADLTAFYGVVPAISSAAWTMGDGLAAAAAQLAEVDRDQRDRAHAMYEQASHQGPLRWLDGGTSPYWALKQRAPYADLIVLGQADRSDLLTGSLPAGFVPDLISDTGRPTLIVPGAGSFEALPQRVLIGWKPTREAARAVNAALPILHLAKFIDVVSSVEDAQGEIDHALALEHWLRGQGITATLRRLPLGQGESGTLLLSQAFGTGADWLVMGCYGHARAREWIAGGATRTVLEAMTLPVLMVH